MKKKELISAISEKLKVKKEIVEDVIDTFQEVVLDECVEKGGEVNLPVIGRFKQKVNSARQGINPLTKAKLDIPESNTLTFKPIDSIKKVISDKKASKK